MPTFSPRGLPTARRVRVAGCAVLAVAALTLSACTKSDDSGGGGGGGDDGPIVIGTSLPLTGEFSQPGTAAKEGYEIWAETINADGGLLGRDVELDVKDDASNQNTIVADYNGLVESSDLLLGTFSSLLNLPASAVAEKNQMLYVEPAGGSPDMFSRDFKFLFFAQQATADKQGDVFATWLSGLPEDQRPQTAAYPTADDPFAQPTSEGIEKILSAAGIETVYRETYALDTKNFDTIVNAMKAKDPDIVVSGAQTEDGIGILRSMLKADFTPDWLYQTNAPSLGDQYADSVGVENTEGVFYSISHSPEASTPGNSEFVKAYEEKFGGPPPEDAADAYAAGQVLATAVEEVGSIDDQLALADWLRENKVDTILGPLEWNDDGSPIGEFLTGQWQDGKTEIVLPPEAATSDKIVMGWEPGGAS